MWRLRSSPKMCFIILILLYTANNVQEYGKEKYMLTYLQKMKRVRSTMLVLCRAGYRGTVGQTVRRPPNILIPHLVK